LQLLQVDIAVKYLGFFLDDDKELERIKEVRLRVIAGSFMIDFAFLILQGYTVILASKLFEV